MRTVHEGDAFSVKRDDLLQIVVVCRRAGRREVDELGPAFLAFTTALRDVNRGDWGLHGDMRDAPMRNDEVYERTMGHELARLMTGFRRRAVLVKTAIGALQSNRAARAVWGEDPDTAPTIFRDEEEALLHLNG